jgi:hypothetical protein
MGERTKKRVNITLTDSVVDPWELEGTIEKENISWIISTQAVRESQAVTCMTYLTCKVDG